MDNDSSCHNDEYCLFEDVALQLAEVIRALTTENERLKQRTIHLKKALEAHECIGCLDRRYPHPKLRDVKCETIHPFTHRTVNDAIKEGKYTLSHFREGHKGFARFLLSMMTSGNEKSYAYIPETTSFYRLVDYHTWEKDVDNAYLRYIIDGMKDIREEYWNKMIDQCNKLTIPAEATLFYGACQRSRSHTVLEQKKLIMMFIRDCLVTNLSI